MCLTYHGYVPGHVLYNKRSVDSNTRMQAMLGCRCGSNVSFEFCNGADGYIILEYPYEDELGSECYRRQFANYIANSARCTCNLQKCTMYIILLQLSNMYTHQDRMKSTVLGCLLLLLDGSCWMVVGGQTCELTCKFGYLQHAPCSMAISPK